MQGRSTRQHLIQKDNHLTVREIRGLLTRIGSELVRALTPVHTVEPSAEAARPVVARRLVESMSQYLRMN